MQRWKRVATATAVLTGSVVAAVTFITTTAGGTERAAPAPKEEHCVVRVLGKATDGELRTTEPVCGPTRAAAMARSGVTAAADWPIGIHFDGPGYSGSSFSVVGADCTGGWLNLPAVWVNRVSSTLHGCPRIRHYDGFNLTSSAETTFYPGANLTTLNNRTNSIQYLP
jgi:hypothetical protein